ncbi:MAG: FecR domain-containing protein [Sphingomonas adhaesiva]|uniref:FecR family protein n=1 Tax=Sphingomonas adhaesiva TaxID=28212 RepID=UPI002FF93FCB
MSRRPTPPATPPLPLAERAEVVFDAFLDGRDDEIHPDDRAEAEAFWSWLGGQERPALPQVEKPPAATRRWTAYAAAAAIVASVGGASGWWLSHSAALLPATEYAAGHAERRVIHLADGSTVTLAADSRVAVRLSAGRRDLRLLQGEALFEVAHDRQRPFVVATAHGEVRAVGTAFDVTLRQEDASVAVVEGVVEIALPSTGGKSAEPIVKMASKGEQVAFGTATRAGQSIGFISQSAAADPASITAWTRGKLVFRGEPLAQVVETINRYATDQLRITDPRQAATPVYGVVDQGDVGAIRDLIDNPDAVVFARAP